MAVDTGLLTTGRHSSCRGLAHREADQGPASAVSINSCTWPKALMHENSLFKIYLKQVYLK